MDEEDGADRPRLRIVEENRRAAAQLRDDLAAAAAAGSATGGAIPSDEQIQRLKARREQARKFGMGAGPGPGGRLAREFIPLEQSVDDGKVRAARAPDSGFANPSLARFGEIPAFAAVRTARASGLRVVGTRCDPLLSKVTADRRDQQP